MYRNLNDHSTESDARIADTRTRIVRAAMELFSRLGYQSTSVQTILSEAGVNAGSLYHFFPGKQDVLVAVLETYRDNIAAMLLEPAWRDVADPIEKVFTLLARYRAIIAATECSYGCPIGSLALEISEPDGSAAPARREFLGMDRRGAGLPGECRCMLAERNGPRGARRVRVDHDGGGGHASADPS